MDENRALPLPQVLSLRAEDIRRGMRSVDEIVVELYEKLRPSLLVYIYHLVGSTRDAEDVVQIAFLTLFDHLTEKAEPQNLRGWLYRVVHNLAIEQARQLVRKQSLAQNWFSDGHVTPMPQSVEQQLIRREQIEKSLEVLNERERRCLMLRAEGLSYQEIGEVLEISSKSVSVYLARGLKKFESKHENSQ